MHNILEAKKKIQKTRKFEAMKNRVTKVVLFNFLACITAFSQNLEIDKGSRVLLSTSKGLSDISFHVYNPAFLAKAVYRDTIEAVNRFPEQSLRRIRILLHNP